MSQENLSKPTSAPSFLQRVKSKCASVLSAEPGVDANRIFEAILPTGNLYGIETGNIDPSWYRQK